MAQKTILCILDGWGIGQVQSSDAIAQAETPTMDGLLTTCPNTTLTTFGESVGLPDGQMGNSEVGHLNLGAGRVVYQDFALINKWIREDELKANSSLIEMIRLWANSNSDLHLIGLVSDGGVHSHIEHLKALIEILNPYSKNNLFIHSITDGRDTDPQSGYNFLLDLEHFISNKSVQISTVIGRYYAMDRDHRWERVKLAYDLMVYGVGTKFDSASMALHESYKNEVTDEFIKPARISSGNNGLIKNGDFVLCFNFRTDRLRELTQVLSQEAVRSHEMRPLSLDFTTMTRYDDSFKNVRVLMQKQNLVNTLGEVLSCYGRTQARLAETEKYPHVSFFFSGGREKLFSGEKRYLVPSPKVATYDLQPEMSAVPLTEEMLKLMNNDRPDFICINFANTDMVGHTGVFAAVQKAAETVDHCLGRIVELAKNLDYCMIILADHGNGDYMINPDGSPNTAHTKNPVPCILVNSKTSYTLSPGALADVAPTLLKLMNLPIPNEMTGKLLIA